MALSINDVDQLLVNQEPYDSQAEVLRHYLGRFSQGAVNKLINYPIQRYSGQTSVHLAAKNGLWECLEILLNNGGNPNALSGPPDLCQTPLHFAASKGYEKCLQILLDHGANMDIRNTRQEKAIHLVRGINCERVFNHTIARFQIPPRSLEQEARVKDLHEQVGLGDALDPFFYNYEQLPPDQKDLATRWTDFYQQTLLYRAASQNSEVAVQFILERSPNQPLHNLDTFDTPLQVACRNNNLKIVSMLLAHSPNLLFIQDVRTRRSPLHLACSRGNLDIVDAILGSIKRILEKGRRPDDKKISLDFLDDSNRTPLFNACYYGFTNIINRLIDFQKAFRDQVSLNVNCSIKLSQRTPLHVAVKRGSVDIVKTLLSAKDIEISPEARPSKDTHKHLIRYIQKRLLGSAMPGQQSLDEDQVAEYQSPEKKVMASPPTVVSPPICASSWNQPSPLSGAYLSDSPDMDSQRRTQAVVNERNAFTLPKKHIHSVSASSTSSVERKISTDSNDSVIVANRPNRSVTDVEPGESSIGVFRLFNGRLEIMPKEAVELNPDYTIFDKLLVTPLAEACVYRQEAIIRMLLEHGARDTSGLACQIANILQKYDCMKLLLSFDCSLVEEKGEKSGLPRGPMGLHLIWNNKSLPSCNGKWFSDDVVFYPPDQKDNDESGYFTKHSKTKLPLVRVPRISQADVSRITIVSLDTNHLSEVPFALFKLPNMTQLNLSRNFLSELPVSSPVAHLSPDTVDLCGWECLHLLELNVSRNKLRSVPSCLWCLPKLKEVNLSNNSLTTLLPSRGRQVDDRNLSHTLAVIDLSSNELRVLPRFVFEFPTLKQVSLSSNKLETLPETMWTCETLQDLDISSNKLTTLPWCETEESMDYSREAQGTGPAGIFKHAEKVVQGKVVVKPIFNRDSMLRRQTSVTTHGRIRHIQQTNNMSWSVNTGITALEGCEYSSLIKLNMSKNILTYYPEALPCLAPNLNELDVSDNCFKQIDLQFIPQSIKKFTARRCQIEQFGNIIDKKLYLIVTHNCRHGKFFSLPCQHRTHTRLPCLANLHLTGNKLQHIQLFYHSPHNHQEKDFDNALKELEYIQGSTSLDLLYPVLEGLDLSKNKLLGTFNPNIGYQTHLKWIWLKQNSELEKLPLEFSHLKNTRQFTELLLEDMHSLVEPPKEYQKVSLTHLLTYMRSRLKESVFYRTIKLFLIGNGERGKTTLLRRLQALPDNKNPARTEGIDIVDWVYPPDKKFSKAKKQVHFLAWDFAGQEVYHTTHQCFYSRRSLYLALFRLCDGEQGIGELEQWLRNVQLRAPGCPVIIIGTHLDMVSSEEAAYLEQRAMQKYSDLSVYPKVVAAICTSSTKVSFFSNHMEKVRSLIYNVACHLQLTMDGFGLEYRPEMSETDPKALFQQQIPKSFLTLQSKIHETVKTCSREKQSPIKEEDEFRVEFRQLFEDDDELDEAVYYLNLQGTLLHFEDHGLKHIYFLDPQWLAKLMANVIQPAATKEGSPIKDGVAEVNHLFSQLPIPQSIKDKYINLLEKFEVALTIKGDRIIIPSLLPESITFPKPKDILSDVTMTANFDTCYQPALRRFWISGYIPDGFWPRLICRIVNDHQISKLLRTVIGEDPDMMEVVNDSALSEKETLNWTPWKTGMMFGYKSRTLLLIKQESNKVCEDVGEQWGDKVNFLKGEHRIEIHIYTDEWITLTSYLADQEQLCSTLPPDCIPGIATRLLVMVTQHIKSLATKYFSGMLLVPQGKSVATYSPCWKCFAEIGSSTTSNLFRTSYMEGDFICKNKNPVKCFTVEDCIVQAAQQEDFQCPLHGKIKVVHMAPDLIFWDLVTQYEESTGQLDIVENEVLGKGGFGFVCKGVLTPKHGVKKLVAVKVFLQDITAIMENCTIPELLAISNEAKHLLFAYKEIRQEVSFLSALSNPFLTELCGVQISPYMCLMLELAPKQSLRVILKEYKENHIVLEPLTLKNTTLQVAKGLEYLHRNQIVHLDMKSPNVLVWHYPSPTDSRQLRVRQAGNVWIKIADYGISQLSTRLTLKVGNNPVGTPGFMAPEMFDHVGQEVSADKVDVFAFGMTLYEMLSHKSPFDNVPHVKRNQEVKNRNRPALQAKETRSLILFQDLMMTCWDHNPEKRPRMQQICQWVGAPEFERLRSEIYLKDVKSISCACVCRILPENEEFHLHEPPMPIDPLSFNNEFSGQSESYRLSSVHEKIDGVFKKYNELEDEPVGSPQHHILLSDSSESLFIETGSGNKIKDEDEDIYQFLPSRRSEVSSELLHGDGHSGEDVMMGYEFEPYTQVWLCGRDKRKGVLQIFTYNDGHVGHYAFSGFCSNEEITAICSVRNLMWMGTTLGTIKIFHAPTLKIRFAGKMEKQEGTQASTILNILYVEEVSSVFVSSHNGEIWIFSDQVVPGGLKVRQHISLPEFCPCFDLIKVPGSSKNTIEVWGTMDFNRLLVLEKPRDQKYWTYLELQANPGDARLKLCSYITHTVFTGLNGRECSHAWISYRNRSLLVSFDAHTRKQRLTLNCADHLRHKEDTSFQVVTLVTAANKLFVGTSGGLVGVFDSESALLLNAFSWHKEKVRTLLVMPKEMGPCVCNEIPFPDQESKLSKSPHTSANVDEPNSGVRPSSSQRDVTAFSYFDNCHYIHNPEPDAVMITSVGNGRHRYAVNEESREDRVRRFDSAMERRNTGVPSPRSNVHRHGEDIVLLTWRS